MKRPPRRRVLLVVVSAASIATGATRPAGGAIADASATAGDMLSVRLEWTAPAECIAGGELERAVSGQLGRPAFSPAPEAELIVRGRVERGESGRHRAEVMLSARTGEPLGARTLDSDNLDCHSLDEALAVMLAIMLNVRRADVPALAREAPPPPPQPRPAWSPRAGAGAGLVLGLLPRAGLETAAELTLRRGGRLEVGLALAFDWSPAADAAEGRIRIGAASARAVLGVAVLTRDHFQLRLRLWGGGGPMWARASGFAQVFTETRPYAEARAGLQAALRVAGPLWLELTAEAGLIALRPTFAVRNDDRTEDTLFRPRLISGAVLAGLAFRGP